MDSDDDSFVPSWKGATGTIILINLYDPENLKPYNQGHLATCKVVKQYLRSSNSQNLGVSFYGLERDSSSLLDAKGVFDVFPLNLPTLEDYKKLRDMDLSTFTQSKELKMSDVLWHCSKIFSNFKKQLSSKSILILSRLDCAPVTADQKPTLKRVVDLADSNVNIKLVNISEDVYEINEFYKNFMIEINKGKEYVLPKPVWKVKDIEKLLYCESQRHLAVAQLQFEIGESFLIGVGIYNLIRSHNSFHKTTNLDWETNAPLSSFTKTTKAVTENNDDSEENGTSEPKQMPLLKSELLHIAEYGNERISFTDKEFREIKNPFGPPLLKLLGFKPSSVLCKEKWFLKMCNFLYPNEALVEGSTVAFKALHKACTEMYMVAICVLSTRINAKPKIVALSPCSHPLGLDVEIGFEIIQIPFVENLRDVPIPEENYEVLTEAHKVAMKHVLEKTLFDFNPDMFHDPKLQSQYRAIEAIALEDEDEEPFTDTTKPNNEAFAQLDETLFHEIFGTFGSMGAKRTASKLTVGGKKPKLEELMVDEKLLKERVATHTVPKFTVAQLKNILKYKDIPDLPALTGLNKDKLVELVYKNYSK